MKMKIKKDYISIYILLLGFLTVESSIALSSTNVKKVAARKASSKNSTSTKSVKVARGTTAKTAVVSNILSDITTNTISSNINDIGSEINDDNCEFNYNLCMNKICNDSSVGKCVCYEDKYTNNSQQFININGNNVKTGFELLEYAKKQCLYILDKCMNVRRSVTEKYNNSIQRDCLMVSQTEVAKNQGLSGELEELKSCIYNHCTASNMGQEDFSMPAYGLCFDPIIAKFQLDANCSYIISKSKTPMGLRELFMNDITKLREEACKKMNGEMSTDRQKCYINVSYGVNKDKISASKKIAVGEFFSCNEEEFGTNLGLTEEYLRDKKHSQMHLAAQNLRAAGNIVGVVVGESTIGNIIDKSIDVTASVANIAVDISKTKDGHLSAKQLMENITNEINITGLNVLQSISLAGQEKNKKKDSKIYGGCSTSKPEFNSDYYNAVIEKKAQENIDNVNTDENYNEKIQELAKKFSENKNNTGGCSRVYENDKSANEKYQNASKALSIASSAVSAASAITNYTMTEAIDSINIDNEKKGVIQHSTFENRDEGVGQVNKTSTARGNCFVNGEWFATENEIILLQWKL